MPLARGYFLGPDTRADAPEPEVAAVRRAAPAAPAASSATIRRTGAVAADHPADRSALVDDLRYWRAGVVILGPHRHAAARCAGG